MASCSYCFDPSPFFVADLGSPKTPDITWYNSKPCETKIWVTTNKYPKVKTPTLLDYPIAWCQEIADSWWPKTSPGLRPSISSSQLVLMDVNMFKKNECHPGHPISFTLFRPWAKQDPFWTSARRGWQCLRKALGFNAKHAIRKPRSDCKSGYA